MASDFPASIDAFPDPLVNSPLNSPSHAALHQDVNDAVEKIEVKLGVNTSPASGASNGEVLMADGSGGSDWSSIGAGNIKTEGAAAGSLLVSDGAGSGAFVTNDIGLVLVKTQAVGTGVSSVTVTGAFNSSYDNYRIIYSGGTQSNATGFRLNLGSANTQYYHWMVYGGYSGGASAPNASGQNNVAQFSWVGGGNSSASISDFDLYSPNKTTHTWFRMLGFYAPYENAGFNSGVLKDNTAHTAFTLTCESGTMTGGTIRVYGYRN